MDEADIVVCRSYRGSFAGAILCCAGDTGRAQNGSGEHGVFGQSPDMQDLTARCVVDSIEVDIKDFEWCCKE